MILYGSQHQMWYYSFAPSGPLSWTRYQMGYYAGHSTKCNTTVRQLTPICLICLHCTKCSTFAWPWVFRAQSYVWLCHGFSVSNPGNDAKCIFEQVDYQSCQCPCCVWKIHRRGMTQSTRNFWRSGWFVGTKLQLKNKKNSPSTINNHLLFDVQTAYGS